MTHKNQQRKIALVVEKLAANKRFHEITLEQVARAAKVGKGTIYRYFKDKDDLFFQVATSGFEQLCELIEKNIPQQMPFPEKLLNTCGQISRFFAARRQLMIMMQTLATRIHRSKGPLRRQWMDKRKKLVNIVEQILSTGVNEGVIRTDIPLEVLANFLLAMLRANARDLRNYSTPANRHKVLVDLFLKGAGANSSMNREGDTE